MVRPLVVGFSANTARPSKTATLVQAVAAEIDRGRRIEPALLDLVDLLPDLAATTDPRLAPEPVRQLLDAIETADALIVGTAVYKGAYTGLFKHVFDLIDPRALDGKPVVLVATGGSERHSLVIDHSLRPLFGFFNAAVVPTGIYATERDFVDGQPSHTALLERIRRAAGEGHRLLAARQPAAATLARIA